MRDVKNGGRLAWGGTGLKISARENKIPSVKIFSFLPVKKSSVPVKKTERVSVKILDCP